MSARSLFGALAGLHGFMGVAVAAVGAHAVAPGDYRPVMTGAAMQIAHALAALVALSVLPRRQGTLVAALFVLGALLFAGAIDLRVFAHVRAGPVAPAGGLLLMVDGQDHLYHSDLSPYLNAGLLNPREVVSAAVEAYAAGAAPLNAVEGFVRQILGWREYVRGLYWLEMPAYAEANALGAARPLPDFYWTGETDMRCLAQAVDVTRREAYAHHIQRLMLLGNFAMLAGVDPKRISDWFLVVYADAYEWVELPNVVGMSQFADGGRLGTKPYAAGGNYIDKMSDHCPRCRYDPKQRTGPDACPFNPLYWGFLEKHRDRLSENARVRYAYLTWDRFGGEQQAAIRADAARVLGELKPEAPGWARPQTFSSSRRGDEAAVANLALQQPPC